MTVVWYLLDLEGQHGPFVTAELREKLAGYPSLENVLIWRDGFQDWKPVSEVFEPFDTPSALGRRKRVKVRWALYGLALGIVGCAADIMFEWRGRQFLPWAGNEAENVGRFIGSAGMLTLMFFLAGAIKDALFSRWKVRANPALGATETSPQIAAQEPIAHRYNNFLARAWQGEYPLAVSYWVLGLIGNFAVGLIVVGLTALFNSRAGFQPLHVFAFILSIWLISIAASVWQWVSVWRSANRYVERKSLKLERAPWAGVAKLMTVIAALQFALAVVGIAVPQVREVSRIAFMDDPDIPAYSIRVMRDGTEAEITGGIKYGLTDDFKKILRASRQIRVVHLNSVGGRIGEGEKLFDLIKEARLNTYVSVKCLSACTLAFSGGVERVLLHGAVLGFHRGSFAGEDRADSPELLGQRKIFTIAGYDAPFIARALATPSSNMWKPTEAELLKSGVVTKVSDGSDYAFSGLPADVSREWLAKSLAESAAIYAAIQARFPSRYDELVGLYYDAFITGKTELEAVTLLRDRLATVISANRHLADDDVILDLANLIADQLAALQTQSPASCYDYAANGVLDISVIPQTIQKRELAIEERIIRTAAERPDARTADDKLWSKLSDRLVARGLGKDALGLIGSSNISSGQQAKYCSVMIALYREAAAMPQNERAVMLRSLVSQN
ncbi:MAG: hypothetical protein JWR80_4113 [Bradyrhizobium sp.]|nr:hypothetical protein [Bradyrhizobium sp.]